MPADDDDDIVIVRAVPKSAPRPRQLSSQSASPRSSKRPANRRASLSNLINSHAKKDVNVSEATDLDFAFSLLLCIPTAHLKQVLRQWSWNVIPGDNSQFIARALLSIFLGALSGQRVQDVMSSHPITRKYTKWVRKIRELHDEECTVLHPAPSQENLLASVSKDDAETFEEQKRAILSAQPNELTQSIIDVGEIEEGLEYVDLTKELAFEEYFRLFVIMRGDEEEKDLSATGEDLPGAPFDAPLLRDSYWRDVAQVFNDRAVQFTLRALKPTPHDTLSLEMPTLRPRSASFLRGSFMEVRAAFLLVLPLWKAYGENDPANFGNFLPRNSDGEISRLGYQVMAMFQITGIGTENLAKRFAAMCSSRKPIRVTCDEKASEEVSAEGSNSSQGTAECDRLKKRKNVDTHHVKKSSLKKRRRSGDHER